MNYDRLEAIKKELDDDQEVALSMLMDLKHFVDNKIKNWGMTGKTFRIV